VLHLRGAVRDHYLRWLGGARPELLASTASRFGRGAYQPEPEQQRVTQIVRESYEAAGGGQPVLESRSWRWTGIEAAEAPDVDPVAGGRRPEQLRFG
jgi:hypothetical protein